MIPIDSQRSSSLDESYSGTAVAISYVKASPSPKKAKPRTRFHSQSLTKCRIKFFIELSFRDFMSPFSHRLREVILHVDVWFSEASTL